MACNCSTCPKYGSICAGKPGYGYTLRQIGPHQIASTSPYGGYGTTWTIERAGKTYNQHSGENVVDFFARVEAGAAKTYEKEAQKERKQTARLPGGGRVAISGRAPFLTPVAAGEAQSFPWLPLLLLGAASAVGLGLFGWWRKKKRGKK